MIARSQKLVKRLINYKSARPKNCRGYIDGIISGHIVGWIIPSDSKGDATLATVSIFVDQKYLGDVDANMERRDLLSAGISSAHHGFKIVIPPDLLDNEFKEIVVKCGVSELTRRLKFQNHGRPTAEPASSNLPSNPSIKTDWMSVPQYSVGHSNKDSQLPERWRPSLEGVLIVGSAPSVSEHSDYIRSFKGEVWALNDALFWLIDHEIQPDIFFCTDGRFIREKFDALSKTSRLKMVSISSVDIPEQIAKTHDITILPVEGRDGFSTEWGYVYHGCSVFFTALHCAVALRYKRIQSVGILLSPPGTYRRVDGSVRMPEYVHHIQMRNAILAMSAIRQLGLHFEPLEATSNLAFM